MTIDDTLRATLFAINEMLLDVLRRLQTGKLSGPDAIIRLRALDLVRLEFQDLAFAADDSPELYERFAAPGGSANRPSTN